MSIATTEGHYWTSQSGLKEGGLKCEGVISPTIHITEGSDAGYDVIVIGGGYAGLCAARDLTSAGKSHPFLSLAGCIIGFSTDTVSIGRSVLMLEGRDRVGGRTYTVEEDGI